MTRTCSDCPGTITPKSTTGRCHKCAFAFNRRRAQAEAAARGEMVASGKRLNEQYAADPVARANRAAGHARWLARQTEQAMGWCPVERRDEYRVLRKKLGAQEARRVIQDEIATAEARRVAALTPLQRQIERLHNGVRLVEVRPMRRAEHAFSLTGCSAGMLA